MDYNNSSSFFFWVLKMIHDYGLKTFHLIEESGEIKYEIPKGEKIVIAIDVDKRIEIITFPQITVGKDVDVRIKRFDGNRIYVELENVGSRKKKGKMEYIIKGLRVWT